MSTKVAKDTLLRDQLEDTLTDYTLVKYEESPSQSRPGFIFRGIVTHKSYPDHGLAFAFWYKKEDLSEVIPQVNRVKGSLDEYYRKL